MPATDQIKEEQLVVFEMAGESYGVDISRVQEINRVEAITTVPEVPEYIKGIINLRGRVTPVIDLRTAVWAAGSRSHGTHTGSCRESPRRVGWRDRRRSFRSAPDTTRFDRTALFHDHIDGHEFRKRDRQAP